MRRLSQEWRAQDVKICYTRAGLADGQELGEHREKDTWLPYLKMDKRKAPSKPRKKFKGAFLKNKRGKSK